MDRWKKEKPLSKSKLIFESSDCIFLLQFFFIFVFEDYDSRIVIKNLWNNCQNINWIGDDSILTKLIAAIYVF